MTHAKRKHIFGKTTTIPWKEFVVDLIKILTTTHVKTITKKSTFHDNKLRNGDKAEISSIWLAEKTTGRHFSQLDAWDSTLSFILDPGMKCLQGAAYFDVTSIFLKESLFWGRTSRNCVWGKAYHVHWVRSRTSLISVATFNSHGIRNLNLIPLQTEGISEYGPETSVL